MLDADMKYHILLVGVNNVDESYYNGNYILNEAERSVTNLYHLIKEKFGLWDLELKDSVYTNQKASWDNVKEYLQSLAKKSSDPNYPPSTLFLYLNGHSSKKRAGNKKTSFCFYDEMVLKDKIVSELARIGSKFRIIWVMDTCYARSYWDKNNMNNLTELYDKLKVINVKPLQAETLFVASAYENDPSLNSGDFGMSLYSSTLFQKSLQFLWEEKNESYCSFFNSINDKEVHQLNKAYEIVNKKSIKISVPPPIVLGPVSGFFKRRSFITNQLIINRKNKFMDVIITKQMRGEQVEAEIILKENHSQKENIKVWSIDKAPLHYKKFAKTIRENCKVIVLIKLEKDSTGKMIHYIDGDESDMTVLNCAPKEISKGVVIASVLDGDVETLSGAGTGSGTGSGGDVKLGAAIDPCKDEKG